MHPKVSIIVPVYNVEKYIYKCLDSLNRQTFKSIEVVIVDDGSTDKSGEIAKKFTLENNNFKYIYKENGGLSSARNKGLDYVKGEWVCFIDSDDYIESTMIETLYNLVNKNDCQMGVCGCKDIYKDKQVITSLKLKDEVIDIDELSITEFLMKKRKDITIVVWNKIYKMDIINKYKLRFEDNKKIFSEDILFNLYYQIHCKKIACTSKPLYNYLIREGSLMNSKKENLLDKFESLLLKYENYCNNLDEINIKEKFIPLLTFELTSIALSEISKQSADKDEILINIKKCRKSSIIKDNLNKLILNKDYSIKDKILSLIYIRLNIKWASKFTKLYYNR